MLNLLPDTSKSRLISGLMSDGYQFIAEERDGRWFMPLKLLPGPQGLIVLALLNGFADETSMPAEPDKLFNYTVDISPTHEKLFKDAKRRTAAGKAGLVLQ